MMKNEAGLYDVAPAGSVSQLLNSRQEQTSYSPTYPNALLFIHTLHVFTMYRTAIGWLVRTKVIYKYVQMYTQDQ
jgi:hypothetical protein